MNAMRSIGLAVAAVMLLSAGPGNARDRNSGGVKAKEVYHIYGGVCYRSWKLLGTHDNVDQACWAAAKFREKDRIRVEVALGTEGKPAFGSHAKEFKIYRNPCKTFNLEATMYNADKAQALADSIKKSGDNAEIVYVFAK